MIYQSIWTAVEIDNLDTKYSLFKGKLQEKVDFLLENGFEPFEIDIKKMNEDIDLLNQMINNEHIKKLWKEVD